MANKKGILEKTVGTVVNGVAKGVDNLLDSLNPFSKSETKKPAVKKAVAKKK